MLSARTRAESGSPAAMASRAASTSSGWGSPTSASSRASASTAGGRIARKRRAAVGHRAGGARMEVVFRGVARTVALFLLCSLAVPVAVTGTVLVTFLYAPLPAVLPEAKNTEASQVSRVLDADGKEIGVFR